MTGLSGGIPELHRQLASLRDAYDRGALDEVSRLADALKRMAGIWPTLPDRQRPDTVPSIFGRTYDENFLSTYLAYVIDPARNGIGQEPLRRLLALAGADLQGVDFETIVIDREYNLDRYGRIDLLIRLNDQIVLGLENKVLAAEGPDQTASYAQGIPGRFPDRARYYLFLTRDGHQGSSNEFVPLSYRRLLDEFAGIPYDRSGDVKKRVLWEDFLEHVRAYIALGEGMMELSEKARLYVENHKMIKDLTKTFESEADAFFTYFHNSLAAGLPADEWTMSFYGTRGAQYFYRPSWYVPELWIYFQYYTSREALIQDSFPFMVDVQYKDAGRFFELFKPRYEQHKDQFERLGLAYRPNHRPKALAWKSYPLDGNPDHVVAQLLRAYEEFSFLTPHLDATLEEYRAQAQT